MLPQIIEFSQDNHFVIAKDTKGFGVWVNSNDFHEYNSLAYYLTLDQARIDVNSREDHLFDTFTRFTGD